MIDPSHSSCGFYVHATSCFSILYRDFALLVDLQYGSDRDSRGCRVYFIKWSRRRVAPRFPCQNCSFQPCSSSPILFRRSAVSFGFPLHILSAFTKKRRVMRVTSLFLLSYFFPSVRRFVAFSSISVDSPLTYVDPFYSLACPFSVQSSSFRSGVQIRLSALLQACFANISS